MTCRLRFSLYPNDVMGRQRTIKFVAYPKRFCTAIATETPAGLGSREAKKPQIDKEIHLTLILHNTDLTSPRKLLKLGSMCLVGSFCFLLLPRLLHGCRARRRVRYIRYSAIQLHQVQSGVLRHTRFFLRTHQSPITILCRQ